MTPRKIYLDNNANAPIHPRVVAALLKEFEQGPGNPSSAHYFGQRAKGRLMQARDTLALFMGCRSDEIIFTSGSTEGNNMIIRGLFEDNPNGHIITSNVEHSSIHRTVRDMEARGAEVSYLKAGLWGAVTPEALQNALQDNTRLIALASINNETGVKIDLEAISTIAHQAQVPLLIDGVAMIGKEPITLYEGITAMTFSGHKFHSPMGVGFSYVKRKLRLSSQITGGEHEYKRRGGTENMPGIAGMAEAIRLLQEELNSSREHMNSLRQRLEDGLLANIPGAVINGEGPRTVNTTNIALPGVDGESLLASLDLEGIAVSHGSACSAGNLEPSRILLSMGVPADLARNSLRFSLSSFNTAEEIDITIEVLTNVMSRLQRATTKS